MTEAMLELSDAPPVSFSMREATMTILWRSIWFAAISSSVKPFSVIFWRRRSFSVAMSSWSFSVNFQEKLSRNLESTRSGVSSM